MNFVGRVEPRGFGPKSTCQNLPTFDDVPGYAETRFPYPSLDEIATVPGNDYFSRKPVYARPVVQDRFRSLAIANFAATARINASQIYRFDPSARRPTLLLPRM